MRRAGRRMLVIGLIATPVVFAAVTFILLRPPGRSDSAIATVNALSATPTFLVLRDLAGLDALAHSRREQQGIPVMGRASIGPDLPVWIFRVGDDVRAFIARDPRNGCPLELYPAGPSMQHTAVAGFALFHDTCHGSLYDDRGRPVGGPSPFYLDQLLLTIKDGAVYASATDVRVGEFMQPQR
jgi:Rieske Fe-S protein